MANPTTGFGFVPVDNLGAGGAFTGRVREYYVGTGDSTALFVGDPVIIAGDFHTDGTPIVTRATVGTGVTTDYITGAVVGFRFINEAMPANKHRAASTAAYVLVADDPNTLFKVRGDGAYATTDHGSTCQIVSGTGSTYTGESGFMLDSSEIAQTATDQLIIEDVYRAPDNELSGSNVIYLVRFNMHTGRLGSAGVD